ncbi:cell envelope integrity protein TolA [Gammaproteobacteria bacterium]|nr:cell envelope integrity protein TolA [Gammaproteobacteria bacterium]
MKTNLYSLSLYITFFIALLILPTQKISADERAKKGKCYITTGYVNNKSSLAAEAKKLFINFNDFELFERKDKKIYITIGKTEQKLFDKLKSDGKTYNFNCSQGKGFLKRYSFDQEFNLIEGQKKFIDFESNYAAVIAPIEAEKKRLVDAEIQKQVEARMEVLRLAEIAKQAKIAAEKERVRLAEIARQQNAETNRLAAIEKAKQDEINRLAAIEQAKQDEINQQKLAQEKKLKAEEAKRQSLLAESEKVARFPLKVNKLKLGTDGAPCSPKEYTYSDILNKPVRTQFECEFGSGSDTTEVIFAATFGTIVRVTRKQYVRLDEVDSTLAAAINFYGTPNYQDEGNWLANYGSAFKVSGNRATLVDGGVGLLIQGFMCGNGRYGTVSCGNKGNIMIKYDLVDVGGFNEQIAAGKARMEKKKNDKIKDLKF